MAASRAVKPERDRGCGNRCMRLNLRYSYGRWRGACPALERRFVSGLSFSRRVLSPESYGRRKEPGSEDQGTCSKITGMNRAFWRSGLPLAAAMLLLFPSAFAQQHARGRKYKPPPPTCAITVTVLRGDTQKPVESAAVVFHPLKDGKDDGNMELKTNEDGKVSLDVVPVGTTLRLQVIAKGFQTYGKDYDLPGDSKEITVRLNKPQGQYSIYQNHPTNDGGQATSEPQKPQ
jgi:hypothetical protein